MLPNELGYNAKNSAENYIQSVCHFVSILREQGATVFSGHCVVLIAIFLENKCTQGNLIYRLHQKSYLVVSFKRMRSDLLRMLDSIGIIDYLLCQDVLDGTKRP